jgi:TPR repeat protein
VKRDYSAAKKYYSRACDLKKQIGCDKYKELNE